MFKKTLVIMLTFLIIFSSVVCVNAFSIDLGGSILTPVSAYYYDLYSGGTGNIVNGKLAQGSDFGGYYNAFLVSYDVRPSASIYPTYIECTFSGSNYGKLDLIYTCDLGGVYADSFNGLYDLSGTEAVKISDFTIIQRNGLTCYSLSYFGFIPTKIGIRAIFPLSNTSSNLLNLVAEITFTPDLSYINQGVIDNQNQNTQDIIDNQNQNAQDIIDNQNQLQENEKVEAGESGNDSLDSVVDAIPNYQDSLKNAFTNFLEVLADTGTEARINFPSISLPAIEGVLPVSIKLSDEMPINLDEWVNKLPAEILSLIRNLLTAGLIIYCVKELYSLIEYFFRGGRLSE